MFDVIIVGAGPAGLSAALVLGRCCRRVLVLDTGVYRNAASPAMHGFLSRDGVAPLEFLDMARAQLARYDTVTLRHVEATDARRTQEGFEVVLADGGIERCRKLLIATGVVDDLPPNCRHPRLLRKKRLSLSLLRWMGSSRAANRDLRQWRTCRRICA
jgi:thioredoxin reductase